MTAKHLALDYIKSSHNKAHNLHSANQTAEMGDDAASDPYNLISSEMNANNPFDFLQNIEGPWKVIADILSSLPERQRLVLSYRLLEFKGKEICELLKLTTEQEKFAKQQGMEKLIGTLLKKGYKLDDFEANSLTKSALTSIKKRTNLKDNDENKNG